MTFRCANPDCGLPTGGRCARESEFDDPRTECPELVQLEEPSQVEAVAQGPVGQPAPWAGESLSPAECADLLARTRPVVVAVAGPQDAGKTCLMVAAFLQLANGLVDGFPYRFASSRSLLGFHRLAERAAAWRGDDAPIVDHTPVNQGQGRFLHLGLRPERREDDRHIDLLLSDFPGEWFSGWSTAPTSELRTRFVERAHAVLVLADASKLTERRYDRDISQLLERLMGAERKVALILTKMDLVEQPPPADPLAPPEAWGDLARARRTWRQVEKARAGGLWGAAYGVSAFPAALDSGRPRGVLAPLAAVLQQADVRVRWRPEVLPIAADASWFECMRRREAS